MRAVSLSNRGGRANNEDCVKSARSGDIFCFVLCDGLGGQLCGEVASRLVCDTVCAEFEKNPEISEEAVYNYLRKSAEILGFERENNDDRTDMASTAAVLVTNWRKAVWAHIGDSRLYHFRDGQIKTVTDDHSIAFMQYADGMITYDDIRRSPNQNKLLRCVCDMDNFDPDVEHVTDVERGDAFLICSDGFWEYVNEDDMEDALALSASPKEWVEKMLVSLHKHAKKNNDNYSAIAVTA